MEIKELVTEIEEIVSNFLSVMFTCTQRSNNSVVDWLVEQAKNVKFSIAWTLAPPEELPSICDKEAGHAVQERSEGCSHLKRKV